ncbi:MAG: diguanylate cyclase [Gammaproteobacteria bacterium]|nr:diguanylate cyclase [Gammaproteobacteria bacterium]MBL7000294.1 diguanylate cyclase [Gammaproteobacteria bacterium]
MGIQAKLILPILVAFLVFASAIHFYWSPSQFQNERQSLIQQLHREFSALDSGLIRNLLENDFSALYATLKDQDEFNGDSWLQLTLYNAKGKRLYPLFPLEENVDNSDYLIPYSHPIMLQDVQLGHIELKLDWREKFNEIQQRIHTLGLYLVLTISLLVLFVISWQKRIIISPLRNLQKASEKMAEGEYESALPESAQDEIGSLTRSFNRMREKVISSQEKLTKAHRATQQAFEQIALKNTQLQDEISQRQLIQEQLNKMALYDQLTALPNRYMLQNEANRILASAKRFGHLVGFMFVDLDGFKAVNDNHNHETGDAVLIEMSLRIAAEVRDIDMLCRVGGDEFIIILPSSNSLYNLENIALRILSAVRKPITSVKIDEALSASIGISVYPADSTNFERLIELADAAMYRAKKAGKDRYAHSTSL